MDNNAVGALLAIGGFVVAFGVAKWVSTRIRQRQEARRKALAASRQSRQVRRAQARRDKA